MNTSTAKAVATPAPDRPQGLSPRAAKLMGFHEQLEGRTDSIRRMLIGTNTDVDFFKQVALTAVRQTPQLLDCDPPSIWGAINKAALDALLPDGEDGMIIVRKIWNGKSKKEVLTAGWQRTFKGVQKKIRRSPEVKSFKAEVVYEADHFLFRKGDDEFIEHAPTLKEDRGPLIAAYAIAKLSNGEIIREVMPAHEIRGIRDKYSESWKFYLKGKEEGKKNATSPWLTEEGEMFKKTVGLRISKWLPMDTDVRQSLQHDDDDVLPGTVEAPAVEPPKRPSLSDFSAEADADGVVIDHDAENGAGGDGDGADVQMKNITPKQQEQKDVWIEKTDVAAGGETADAASRAVAEKPPAEPTGPQAHALRVMNIKATLANAPRDVQNEIFDTRIIPQQDLFSEEEIEAFNALLKED